MTNGRYLIEDYDPVFNSLPNLNSYYTLRYQGLYAGYTYHVPIHKKLTAFTSLTYTPLALTQGYGWWNLRNLAFSHFGLSQMVSTELGLTYRLAPSSSLTVAYRYQHNSLWKGWENKNNEVAWSKAVDQQRCVYIVGNYKF